MTFEPLPIRVATSRVDGAERACLFRMCGGAALQKQIRPDLLGSTIYI